MRNHPIGLDPAALTQQLIRARSVNPPGDEAGAHAVVAELLDASGIETNTIAAVNGRPNLVARLRGRGTRPGVVLHGHLDVVGVDGQDWETPPFEGAVIDGILHGRGTLDNKAGVAMLAHAFARAAKSGETPSGDIVLILAADSETGGSAGMAHLLDHHPEVVAGARFAIGEFGGFPLHAFGRRFYRIGVGLKGYAHLRLRLSGRGGHGSRPETGTLIGSLGRLLERIDNFEAPHSVTPVAQAVVDSIAAHLDDGDARLLRGLLDPDRFDDTLGWLGPHRATFEAMFRDTANATIVRSGDKFNVIPATAEVEVDARLLPGHGPEALLEHLRSQLDQGIDIDVLDTGPENPPDYDDELLDMLGEILTELDPDAVPIPYLFSESPDGRLFAAHGIQHYGYLPMNLPPEIDLPDLIHGPNERVPTAAIEFGAEAIHRLITRY